MQKGRYLVSLSVLVFVAVLVYFFRNKTYIVHAPVQPVVATATSSDLQQPSQEESVTPVEPALSYTSIVLATDMPGKEIVSAIGGYDHLQLLLSLNRVDDRHLQKGMTIVIPSSFDDPWLLTGFPRTITALTTVPKIMLISQKTQEFGAYEYGQLVRFGGISTGKKVTPTKNGLYHTNWKAKETISTVNDEWLLKWNFNIDNTDGIGIHEYELPGYPASHSCIRFSALDAEWFYTWAEQWKLSPDEKTILAKGTPVYVFGTYDFNTVAPWKKLPEDLEALKAPISDIDFALIQ